MAVSEVNYFSVGGEDFYIQTATTSAEVKAWDGASFANNVVTITLPFAPKYIYTRSRYTNGDAHWVNIWDSDISQNNFIQFGENNTPTVTSAAQVVSLPNPSLTWLKSVTGNVVEILLPSTLTLTDALFIAVGQ